MKRTDRMTHILIAVLFLAFVAYVTVFAVKRLGNATVTAQAVTAEVRIGGVATGIVVREETVVCCDEPYLDITAQDGEKIAAGGTLGTAMRSETGLERANRIHELELEIERISAVLAEKSSAEDLTARDAAISSAVENLASDIARHSLNTLEEDTLNVRALLYPSSDSGDTESELREKEQELESLRSSSSSDTRSLTAPLGGVFSSAADGYEGLTAADLEDLTPEKLRALLDREPETPDGAYGKLITSHIWYFAAAMDARDAANLTVGRTAQLDFGRWYSSPVYGKVTAISAPQDGTVAVTFRCDTALADTAAMRSVSADVVFESFSGVRVPAEAVRTDEETESTYVWTVTAMLLERKDVTLIYCGEDYVVAERESAAGSLREGDTVVVSGNDLYEGKLMK